MKANGSVLIVVLGLLAILAVVGVAFVTMSTIDRSTAANFAVNTQIMMAADGGVEYACHYLVNDVWQVTGTGTSRKYLLLTGAAGYEVYDYPGTDDAWLTDTITTTPAAPTNISFKQTAAPTPLPYGLTFNTTAAGCDNLGIGGTNGVFIADLAFPFEGYVGRVSLTILDHGGLLNLNAHGNKAWTGGPGAEFLGLGYYISDVNPAYSAAPISQLADILFGSGTTLGRWGGATGTPNIPETGETCIEYPALGTNPNYPFTVDEEFELRRIQDNPLNGGSPGTLALSRIELMVPSGNSMSAVQRLMYTTVGWTSEVSGDGNATSHRPAGTGALIWSRPKADVNRAKAQDIFEALNDNRVGTSKQLGQLTANIIAFRSSGNSFKPIAVPGASGTPFVGADRQPLITEAGCSLTHASTEPGDNNVYEIKVEVHNPWPGEVTGIPGPLNTGNMKVTIVADAQNLPATMAPGACEVITKSISLSPADNIANKSIKLTTFGLGKDVTLDEITGTDMGNLASGGHLSRPVLMASETRGPGCEIPVLYIRDWDTGGAEAFGTPPPPATSADNTVPIRFPNSVTAGDDGAVAVGPILPPFASSGGNFRGIARLGDLDQILCPENDSAAGDAFWPWTNRVAKCTTTDGEAALKFNWKPKGAIGVGTIDLSLAANVLSVGGPWDDNLDNEGDSKIDAADTGYLGSPFGRSGGPELRVAGRINLNTATPGTLLAMNDGLTLNSQLTLPTRPLRTPAEVLRNPPSSGASEARGYLENRDWVFNRISNIATIRSDTYSVYGTVQLGTVPVGGSTLTVARTRRFWALLDRSVSLAYPPGHVAYMHPRIMNFQWLD